jgi:hypothetical protein
MRFHLAAASISFFALVAGANAQPQTTLPLNTGYNNGAFTLYPLPVGSGTVSDNYWIKVSASAPPVPQAAFVVNPNSAWAPTLSAYGVGSRWISPTGTGASLPGASGTNPSYFIFKKCFCLMPGYQNPQISYQLRGDENTQVWLNALTNVISGPSAVNFGPNSAPVNGSTNNAAWFRTGVNCIYVLLDDTGGAVGFNLAGTVSATGLMPVAASGTGASFEPCQCGFGKVKFDDRPMLQAIARLAQERLRQRR